MGLDHLPPSTCVHLSLTPSPPPCGRHKWMAPNESEAIVTVSNRNPVPVAAKVEGRKTTLKLNVQAYKQHINQHSILLR